ncbi:hypothetical protein ACF3NT_04210 [Naumannella halotolerans]|uniref:Uncharacterized protein n=1 Tax=Naumannella halotolerans TaxID=993414 RepID=A0A4R7J9I6_9ACTN|nr:hypothetical protein [Naumannella halotolerans]TDT33257.1 hypothetical protein CLV29_0862 [Naumannella halotolerans]
MDQSDANPESWHLVAGGADSPALLGATLGYGLLDEPIEHYGALQQLATALRTELSRPVELEPVDPDPARAAEEPEFAL